MHKLIYLIGVISAAFQPAPEVYDVHTPFQRIEGTNYVIHNKDTFLIIKEVRVDYHYRVLSKEDRAKLKEQLLILHTLNPKP